jgi:hypothetical protein
MKNKLSIRQFRQLVGLTSLSTLVLIPASMADDFLVFFQDQYIFFIIISLILIASLPKFFLYVSALLYFIIALMAIMVFFPPFPEVGTKEYFFLPPSLRIYEFFIVEFFHVLMIWVCGRAAEPPASSPPSA